MTSVELVYFRQRNSSGLSKRFLQSHSQLWNTLRRKCDQKLWLRSASRYFNGCSQQPLHRNFGQQMAHKKIIINFTSPYKRTHSNIPQWASVVQEFKTQVSTELLWEAHQKPERLLWTRLSEGPNTCQNSWQHETYQDIFFQITLSLFLHILSEIVPG